jgi:hypothetical protein
VAISTHVFVKNEANEKNDGSRQRDDVCTRDDTATRHGTPRRASLERRADEEERKKKIMLRLFPPSFRERVVRATTTSASVGAD